MWGWFEMMEGWWRGKSGKVFWSVVILDVLVIVFVGLVVV